MPTSIAEQVRHLGEVLEDFIDDVVVDEVLSRVDARELPVGSDAQLTSQHRSRARQRSALLPAAVVVMVVGLVGSLWLVAGDREPAPTSQSPALASTTTSVTTIDPGSLGTIPPENLAANAVLRTAVDTPVGRFEIYDQPGAQQTSMYLRRTDGSVIGGQFDNTTIDEGLAWSLIGGEHEESQLAWGLAPGIDDFWVEVADQRIEPDANGIWYATVDESVLAFTIHAPGGPITVGANPDPVATTTTTIAGDS